MRHIHIYPACMQATDIMKGTKVQNLGAVAGALLGCVVIIIYMAFSLVFTPYLSNAVVSTKSAH